MSLQSFIDIRIRAALTAALDLVSKSAALDYSFGDVLDSGTGADQADVIFSDIRSTATNEDLDLVGGGLLDNLGAAFAPAKLKLIFVFAAIANAGNIVIKRPATLGVPFLDTAGDSHSIKPGGTFLLYAPTAAGICSVTADTGDIINMASSSGTGTYSIILVGTSV